MTCISQYRVDTYLKFLLLLNTTMKGLSDDTLLVMIVYG